MPNAFEELGAKGAGKAKAAVAALKGLSGIFNVLVEEHAEAKVLLKRAKAAEGAEKRRDLWLKIRVELLSHERGELDVLYPVLREYAETRMLAEQHEQEAGELEACIKSIDAVDYASSAWHLRLEQLISLVTGHVEEEEKQWFPKAMKAIGKQKAAALEPQFLARKKTAAAQVR